MSDRRTGGRVVRTGERRSVAGPGTVIAVHPPRRRTVRLAVLGVATTVAGVVALFGIEVQLAMRGVRVPTFDPHLADGVVTPDGVPATAEEPRHVIWLGDSTAAGEGASGPAQSLPSQIARRGGRAVRLEVRAISGARVDEVEGQAVGIPPDVDVVFISAGANDVNNLTSLGDIRASYERVLDAVPDGVPVVALGVPAMGTARRLAQPLRWAAGVQAGRVDGVVRDVAADRGLTYVDIAGATEHAFASEPDRYFAADFYHPNDEGYRLWADAVIPHLPAVLR